MVNNGYLIVFGYLTYSIVLNHTKDLVLVVYFYLRQRHIVGIV